MTDEPAGHRARSRAGTSSASSSAAAAWRTSTSAPTPGSAAASRSSCSNRRLANDPAFRTRFRREAQDAAKMAHPTIVRIFDAGEEIVREPNGTRDPACPSSSWSTSRAGCCRTSSPRGRWTSGRRVADHRAGAHRARVLAPRRRRAPRHQAGQHHGHRDRPGEGHGLRHRAGDLRLRRRPSRETSAIVGTAQYFSPEQARGEAVDARTDLYSTGVVFFELLTGRAPFRGDNPVAVAYQHVNADAVPPSSINPGGLAGARRGRARALAKDRFERYQSASEFREDVETAAGGDIPTTAGREQRRVQRDACSARTRTRPPGPEAALRQLAVDNDRAQRTQSRPPVAWIWAGIALMAVDRGGRRVLGLHPRSRRTSTRTPRSTCPTSRA